MHHGIGHMVTGGRGWWSEINHLPPDRTHHPPQTGPTTTLPLDNASLPAEQDPPPPGQHHPAGQDLPPQALLDNSSLPLDRTHHPLDNTTQPGQDPSLWTTPPSPHPWTGPTPDRTTHQLPLTTPYPPRQHLLPPHHHHHIRELRSMCGRYASYWNAILCCIYFQT